MSKQTRKERDMSNQTSSTATAEVHQVTPGRYNPSEPWPVGSRIVFSDGVEVAPAAQAEELPANPTASPAGNVSAELMEELREANAELLAAEAEMEEAKEVAKAKTEACKVCQRSLNAVVQKILNGKAAGLPLMQAIDQAGQTDDATGEDAWKLVPLADLKPAISPRYLKALAENIKPIVTIGDLTDWQAAKGDFWAADIKGVGKAAQDEIAAATEQFWTDSRQHEMQAVKTAATESMLADGDDGAGAGELADESSE